MKNGFASLAIILVAVVIFVVGVFYALSSKSNTDEVLPPNEVACTADAKVCPDGSAVGRTAPNCEFAPCPDVVTLPESFDAKFEVYTNNTKRIFSAAMYRKQSEDAYIGDDDASVVHVERAGVTWGEFFSTLPFSLDEKCLTTGTGQTFCTGAEGTLKFMLNGDEAPNALSVPISEGDLLVVRFE
jgi:hypothetical protein